MADKPIRINAATFNNWLNQVNDGEADQVAEELVKHSVVVYGKFLLWLVDRLPCREYVKMFEKIQASLAYKLNEEP